MRALRSQDAVDGAGLLCVTIRVVAPETTPGFRRIRFSSTDGTTYRTVFEREYGGTGMYDGASPDDQASFVYTITGDDRVSLRSLDAPGSRRGMIGPRSDHVVFWLMRGRLVFHFGEGEHAIAPGTPWIASASASYHFDAVDTLYNGLHIDDSFLREVAREVAMPLPPGDLSFAQQDDRIAGLAPLRTLMNEIGPQFADATLSAPARRALDARIAATVLETFPSRAGGTVVGASGRLRDAVSFIQPTAGADDQPRRHRRRRRPQRPRRAAAVQTHPRHDAHVVRARRPPRPACDRISSRPAPARSASARWPPWRLTHLGRFAAGYRARFGELPTETLRRQGA